MRIVGLGNDIIEISRIEKALENLRFKEKVYTHKEREIIDKKGNSVQSYAGRFSAKEAIAKALGTGVRKFNLTDIEILNDELGKPFVKFYGELEKISRGYRVELSISHCKEYATAVAIIYVEV